MKKLYGVSLRQDFQVKHKILFKTTYGNHWIIRTAKYFYCENEKVAIESYQSLYGDDNKKIMRGGNWSSCDETLDILTQERAIYNIKRSHIILHPIGRTSLNHLKENMSAEDFKEWWHDTKKEQ